MEPLAQGVVLTNTPARNPKFDLANLEADGDRKI